MRCEIQDLIRFVSPGGEGLPRLAEKMRCLMERPLWDEASKLETIQILNRLQPFLPTLKKIIFLWHEMCLVESEFEGLVAEALTLGSGAMLPSPRLTDELCRLIADAEGDAAWAKELTGLWCDLWLMIEESSLFRSGYRSPRHKSPRG